MCKFNYISIVYFIQYFDKSGSRTDAAKYLRINKLSALAKLFETVTELSVNLKRIITQEDRSFFSGRSIITNLSILTDFRITTLENRYMVECVYFNT